METSDFRLNLISDHIRNFSNEQIAELPEEKVEALTEAFMAPYLPLFLKNPQSEFFTKQNMQRFVSAVLESDPDRLEDFHISRLRGLGGSEIGAVIGQEFDMYNPYKTRRDVVRSKLLLSYPAAPNGHMRRGNIMEPHIRYIFRGNSQIKPMDAQLKMLASFNNTRLPWLVGTPDDLVEIAGKVYLIDYKCPSDADFAKIYARDVPFDYKAQLHHYAIVCREAGIKIDGLLLCAMSASQEVWQPEIISIEMSNEMFQAIEDIGNDVWSNNVLTGILPDFKKRNALQLVLPEDANSQIILSRIEDAAVLNIIAKEAVAKEKTLKEEINLELKALNLSGELKHAGVKVSSVVTVNVAAMIECLTSYEVDVDLLINRVADKGAMELALVAHDIPLDEWTVPGQPDFEKMSEMLTELGEDMDRFSETSFSLGLTRSKKGPDYEILSENKSHSITDINFLLANRRANAQRSHAVKVTQDLNTPEMAAIPEVAVSPAPVLEELVVAAEVNLVEVEHAPLKRKF